MRCAKWVVGFCSNVMVVTATSDAFAQVTLQQALDAAGDATATGKEALDERADKSSFFSGTMGNGLTQIVRAAFNLGQMTAQEKSDCGKYMNEMFDAAWSVHSLNQDGNASMQGARVDYLAGLWYLVGGNAANAKTLFDSAESKASTAKDKWSDMSLYTTIMQSKIDSLKNIIDNAIN